jgi:hypothetical protein
MLGLVVIFFDDSDASLTSTGFMPKMLSVLEFDPIK